MCAYSTIRFKACLSLPNEFGDKKLPYIFASLEVLHIDTGKNNDFFKISKKS